MPMINFLCEECGEKFSELVNSRNRDKVKCPDCGSGVIKQIFEGKCNSLRTLSKGGSNEGKCNSCPMSCRLSH